MEFQITCSCGAQSTVGEGSAGVRLTCTCGRAITVPPLDELRRLAGVPLDPERLIRAGLDENDLFPDKLCCHCGDDTDQWLPVMIECESGIKQGGFSWAPFLLGLLAGFIVLRARPTVVHPGKGYRVPLIICPKCQGFLQRKKTLKECLRQVAVYKDLLDKYPDADVYVINHAEPKAHPERPSPNEEAI